MMRLSLFSVISLLLLQLGASFSPVIPSTATHRKFVLDLCTDLDADSLNSPGSLQTSPLPVVIKVDVGDGEPIESALRRFKREVNKSGHLMELRHKRYFENSQERKKRKVKEGRMRVKFERMQRRKLANRT